MKCKQQSPNTVYVQVSKTSLCCSIVKEAEPKHVILRRERQTQMCIAQWSPWDVQDGQIKASTTWKAQGLWTGHQPARKRVWWPRGRGRDPDEGRGRGGESQEAFRKQNEQSLET